MILEKNLRFFSLNQTPINLFHRKKLLFALLLFLLVFPKGGFKMAGIPITWGYLLLGLFACGTFSRKIFALSQRRLLILLFLLPFQILSLCTMFVSGISSIGMTVSFYISFFFLPFTFLFLFGNEIDAIDEMYFTKLFKNGVLFIATYGIFLFFFKYFSGKFLEIPFLTVNFNDLGGLEDKHINRGFAFKLISTYNNGNIYGICLLMLLPLYCWFEKRKWALFLVKLSLLLTLSRTVWIGMFFHEFLFTLFLSQNKKQAFLNWMAITLILIASLMVILHQFQFTYLFLFDRNLGGRSGSLQLFFESGWFSSNSFGGIIEIVYAGIASSFGWAGLIAYLFAMFGPFFALLQKRTIPPVQKSMAVGLANYLFLGLSDGAILYLPTMGFYWFLASFMVKEKALEPQALTCTIYQKQHETVA